MPSSLLDLIERGDLLLDLLDLPLAVIDKRRWLVGMAMEDWSSLSKKRTKKMEGEDGRIYFANGHPSLMMVAELIGTWSNGQGLQQPASGRKMAIGTWERSVSH